MKISVPQIIMILQYLWLRLLYSAIGIFFGYCMSVFILSFFPSVRHAFLYRHISFWWIFRFYCRFTGICTCIIRMTPFYRNMYVHNKDDSLCYFGGWYEFSLNLLVISVSRRSFYHSSTCSRKRVYVLMYVETLQKLLASMYLLLKKTYFPDYNLLPIAQFSRQKIVKL